MGTYGLKSKHYAYVKRRGPHRHYTHPRIFPAFKNQLRTAVNSRHNRYTRARIKSITHPWKVIHNQLHFGKAQLRKTNRFVKGPLGRNKNYGGKKMYRVRVGKGLHYK